MQASWQAEDHQNIVQCYNECSGDVLHTQKLYLERYGLEPSPETISIALTLHSNNKLTESNAEVEDVDMTTNTEHECEKEIIIKDEIETNELILSSRRVPVVYTTRLDEMHIFVKNFESLTVGDIVESIILESKPKLTEPLKHQDECILTFDGHPFFKLVEKIKQFNEFSSYKDSEEEIIPLNLLTSNCVDSNFDHPEKTPVSTKKKKKAKNVCKPSTVPSSKKRRKRTTAFKQCTIPLVPSRKVVYVNGKSYVIYDSKKSIMTFNRGVRYIVGIGCIIVFRNVITNSSESFVIEKTGLCSKTSNTLDSCGNWLRHGVSFGLDVDECCWFYREYVINSLIVHKSLSPSFPNVFKKPHSCPSGQCNCCCKTILGKKEDDKVPENLANYLVNSLEKSQSKPLDNFIIKTLAYTRNKILTSPNNVKTIASFAEIDDCVGVQILKDYSDMTEFYEIRTRHEHIVKHIEMKSKYLHMSNNFRNAMKLNADSDKVYCCWRKRDAMLRSFEFRHKPMITQFIRTPHPCPPDHCICCCKPSLLKTSLKVDDLTSSKYAPKHSHNYKSLIKQRRKFLAKPKPQGDINALLTDQYIHNNEPVHLEESGQNIPIIGIAEKLQKINSLQTVVGKTSHENNLEKKAKQTKIVNTTSVAFQTTQPLTLAPRLPVPINLESSLPISQQERPPLVLHHPRTTQLVQSNIAFQQKNVRPTLSPLVNAPFQNEAQDPTVNSLVNTILQRFQDVRLIITPDGDVSAELNMPIQTLSTQELQFLSKILTHAKEQVEELKAAGHLNSSTNTVINPWLMNPGSNTNSTQVPGVNSVPSSHTTTPVVIQNPPTALLVTVNSNNRAEITHSTNSAEATLPPCRSLKPNNSIKIKKIKENVNDKSRHLVFQCYTNLSALKMKEYMTSCKSYLNVIKTMPKIQDVFSLNENVKNKKNISILRQSKINSKNENTLDNNTSRVKRKLDQNSISNTKKPKTVDVNKTVAQDAIKSVTDGTPMATLTPMLLPNTGLIPADALVVIPRAPILSGLLSMPYAVPEVSSVIDPKEYVAVQLPGGVASIETQYDVKPSPNDDGDDDCILGC